MRDGILMSSIDSRNSLPCKQRNRQWSLLCRQTFYKIYSSLTKEVSSSDEVTLRVHFGNRLGSRDEHLFSWVWVSEKIEEKSAKKRFLSKENFLGERSSLSTFASKLSLLRRSCSRVSRTEMNCMTRDAQLESAWNLGWNRQKERQPRKRDGNHKNSLDLLDTEYVTYNLRYIFTH